MWRVGHRLAGYKYPIQLDGVTVAYGDTREIAARIVAAMNAAEAECTYARTCVPGNRDPRCPVHAPKPDAGKP